MHSPGPPMGTTFAPGDFVLHPDCPDWGLGQVQSVEGTRITVNFENVGKQTINGMIIALQHCSPDEEP